jgi:hypothetical protein
MIWVPSATEETPSFVPLSAPSGQRKTGTTRALQFAAIGTAGREEFDSPAAD